MMAETETVSPDKLTVIQEARRRVEARYSPPNRKGGGAWDGNLSVSKLCSMSAYEYAEKLTHWQPDSVDPYYAFKGNALGDRALEGISSREIQVTYKVDDQCMLTGSMDGVCGDREGVAVLEHKAYGEPDGRGIQKARMQGETYLSMMWESVQLGAISFKAAPWHNGPQFLWPTGAVPTGILVCIAPDRPPGKVLEYRMGAEDCSKHMQKMHRKCAAIIDAVRSGDMGRARDWDKTEGQLDFLTLGGQPLTELPSDISTLAKEVFDLQEQERMLKADIKEKKAILMGHLDQEGLTKAHSGGVNITIQQVEGGVISEHYRSGYRTVKVT